MEITTITGFARDSIQDTIKMLEERGFYVLHSGATSNAPRTHHKTLQARRRARETDTVRLARELEQRRLQRRREQQSFKGKWRALKKSLNSRARKKGEVHSFHVSLAEWHYLWRKAGYLTKGDGTSVPAWKMRGRDKEGGWGNSPEVVQLRRWDLNRPYTLDNLYVVYKDSILADGYQLAEQLLNEEELDENNLKIVEEKT